MQTHDGGIKPYRTALKHKNVIMCAVQHVADDDINYKNLACTSFLNSWKLLKFQQDQKQPGTIQTYIGSDQIFSHFCILKQITEILSNDEF